MDEQTARILAIYIRQMQAWSALALACPNVQQQVEDLPVPGVPRLSDPTTNVPTSIPSIGQMNTFAQI